MGILERSGEIVACIFVAAAGASFAHIVLGEAIVSLAVGITVFFMMSLSVGGQGDTGR